jgi:glutathione S-transferase
MAKHKAQLITALSSLELRLKDSDYLAGPAFSLADVVLLADLRAAFEKVRSMTEHATQRASELLGSTSVARIAVWCAS